MLKKLKNPYMRLMRLHQPIGVWLLFFPCAWAIMLASGGVFNANNAKLLVLFAIGAVLMRSAGCVINDIADRKIDVLVERTKTRPLASGEIKVWQAVVLLALLLFLSLLVAVSLGLSVLMWAALSLLPVIIYPLMKRISWWPQLFLGLVFNWGAIMGWVAVRGVVELPAFLLYLGGICWTLGYDTIYAHQDKADDSRIGVKSTALRLGAKTKPFVAVMYGLATLFFMFASGGFIGFIPVMIHATWQIRTLNIDSPASARKTFLSNVWFGSLVLIGLVVAG